VRLLLERKLAEAAPDICQVTIELPEAPPGGFVPIDQLQPADREK
jgi:hypothetical protein